MRETILLDALEKIKKECASDYAIDIATKALSDYASAPESGGEEKEIRQLIKTVFMEAQKGGGYTKETEDYFVSKFKDFVPNKTKLDVTPVASHSCASSNSIEQLIKKYKTYYGNVQWHIRTNKPPEVEVKKLNRQLDDYNEIIIDLRQLLSNSEQEDKRSVATEDAQSVAAGTQTSLPKEEGKDELRKRAEYWEQRCGYAEYMMGIDASKLQPQYSQWRALKENGLKGEGE